jgi:uncharacterized protein
MSGAEPEERVQLAVVHQTWRDMAFLHWSLPPDRLRAAVPSALELDLHDGRAWIGITAFEVADQRLAVGPPLPGWSIYPETNVRTYVRGPDGRDGIWFFTLEVDNVATVAAARPTLGVPYRWARMRVTSSGSSVHRYDSERRGCSSDEPPGHHIALRADPEPWVTVDGLGHFLTGRWRAFSRPLGLLVATPVEHTPWPLHDASILEIEQTLLTGFGIDRATRPEHVLWSPGVQARLGPPRRVRARDPHRGEGSERRLAPRRAG